MKCCATLQGFLRIPVILGALLPILWMVLHATALFGSQHGIIRFTLVTIFTLLILFRPNPKKITAGEKEECQPSLKRTLCLSLIAATAVIIGLIIPIRQLEWLGLLLLVYTCLASALPPSTIRNLLPALLVLYWVNPLPNALFCFLQTAMQSASVNGAEWFLHLIDTPVWADGMVLRTGSNVFEVPAWCSGMRTATTVFILSLAIGILRRLRLLEILIFIIWSLAHALVLNVLRISAMIYFAPWMQIHSSLDFLHDTSGLIVGAGVFLVYIELLLLENDKRRRQHRIEMLQAALHGGLSEYPPFWHGVLRRRRTALFAIILLVGGGAAAWKSRTTHRITMLQGVAATLRDNGDIGNARRLATLISARSPENLEWKFTAIRLDLIAGESQRVLDALERLPDIPPSFQLQRRILQAYALIGLGRQAEAASLVDTLSTLTRTADPRIAMILAEIAVQRGDDQAVARHITMASGWTPNSDRIRNLYPYLRVHHQWAAMAATDSTAPYTDPIQTFSILEAQMNLNNTPRVAALTLEAQTRWPHDPRLIEPLFFMAIRHEGDWESRFSAQLLNMLPSIRSPETLYAWISKCFQLTRPDLAWTLYRRIEILAPGHPLLSMAVAEYGHRWFIFRRYHIGMPSGRATDTIDLKPYFLLGNMLPSWQPLTRRVPLGPELSGADTVKVRKQFLQNAITTFGEYERREALPSGLHYLYAQALERSGRLDLARERLNALARNTPGEADTVRERYSEMLERKGAWMQVYEILRTYLLTDVSNETSPPPPVWPPVPVALRPDDENIHLPALRRLVKSQTQLGLPLAAEFTARTAVQLYPQSPQARAQLAATWMRSGNAEGALQLLESPNAHQRHELDILEIEALFATQRFSEISAFCRERLLPLLRIPSDIVQYGSLPPAEASLQRHISAVPSESEFAVTAQTLREHRDAAGEGLRPMLTLWLDAWAHHCEGDQADPQRWIAAGRDRLEQATALHQLTLLLCREHRFMEAQPAARLAVAALPESPALWQILIGLEGGTPDTLALARRFCPYDADLWLADLVTRTRSDPRLSSSDEDKQRGRNALRPLLDEGLVPNTIHTAGLIRAADYLQRLGLYDEADPFIAALNKKSRGLLPAYILEANSAFHAQDKNRALAATTRAIDASILPVPALFKNLVILKSGRGEIDTESSMVNALRNLRENDQGHPLWPQMLGYIRFLRGGREILEALYEMNAAITGGATNLTPFIISAEASRLLRNYDQSAKTLRRALQIYPGNSVLINNLAMTLVQTKEHAAEAMELLPNIIPAAENDPRILDTLAIIYLRNGNYKSAGETVVRNLRHAEPGSPLWFRCQTHLAEIAWKQGDDQTAISMLSQILRGSKNIPDDDILAANMLLSRITAPATTSAP